MRHHKMKNARLLYHVLFFAAIAFPNRRHDRGAVPLKLNANGCAVCFQTQPQSTPQRPSPWAQRGRQSRMWAMPAEPMTCPALPSGPTSRMHPTALLLREEDGRLPLSGAASGPCTQTRHNQLTPIQPQRHQPPPQPLFVYPPSVTLNPLFHRCSCAFLPCSHRPRLCTLDVPHLCL